jgi:hypothetical protein
MMGMSQFLTCDFDLPLNLFSGRAERDIRKEFEIFENEYDEKKARVCLREDLEAFFMQSGAMLPMNFHSVYVQENLWSHNAEMHQFAIPKNFDISPILGPCCINS